MRPGRESKLGLPVAFLCALVAACGARASDGAPRNLILISLDTLRPDHLSCYGHTPATSPTIDALAARGVRFADASSAAPWTLPSHTTMFTGLYPSHHGVKDYANRLAPEATTLAEVLAQHGFQTWAVINTWNIADPRFEIFQGFAPDDVHYIKEESGSGAGQVILDTGPEVEAQARACLERRRRDQPFFLFAHFYDAHTDFTPEPSYRDAFVQPYAGKVDGTTGQLMAIRNQGLRLRDSDLAYLRQLYDAEIRQLDDVLARFFAFLEREDLLDDTLVVLVSDHGEEFQEHGGLLHGRSQHQELLRVPWILAGPGIPRGVVVQEPVGLVDLLPTVLARFGLAPPGPLDGVDVAPTWSGGTLGQRLLFGEADHNNIQDGKPVVDIKRMARLGSSTLHVDRTSGAATLFDLAGDPGEQHDRAGDDPERVALLRAALARFLDGAVAGQESGAALTEENLELLRKLGYAGEDEAGETGSKTK
jgi:arylsulfatase A-like enzyme